MMNFNTDANGQFAQRLTESLFTFDDAGRITGARGRGEMGHFALHMEAMGRELWRALDRADGGNGAALYAKAGDARSMPTARWSKRYAGYCYSVMPRECAPLAWLVYFLTGYTLDVEDFAPGSWTHDKRTFWQYDNDATLAECE